ncbi:MAG: hypothetical protein ACK4IK_06335 [Bacteroidia bacterium]
MSILNRFIEQLNNNEFQKFEALLFIKNNIPEDVLDEFLEEFKTRFYSEKIWEIVQNIPEEELLDLTQWAMENNCLPVLKIDSESDFSKYVVKYLTFKLHFYNYVFNVSGFTDTQNNIYEEYINFNKLFENAISKSYFFDSTIRSIITPLEVYYYIIEKLGKENKKQSIDLIQNPFKDDKTLKIFNSLNQNWKYDKDLKYSYLFNFLEDKELGVRYKNDYESYVRGNFGFKGKFQYEKATAKKILNELEEVFSKI